MNIPIMGAGGGFSVDSGVSLLGRYKAQIMAGVFYLFLLAGCGFHLRGEMVLSPILTAPYVNTADAEFKEDLTKVLNRSGIRVVNDADNASAIIDLVSVKYDRQVLSINSRGQATGYILTYEVFCQFVDRTGRVLTSPARLKISRTLEYQSTQVLPKKQEEDALRARMREDLVQQILRRLNSVSQAPPGGLKTEQFS